MWTFSTALRQQLSQRLDEFDAVAIDNVELRPAAVCITIVDSPTTGDACFLLTSRPANLKRHAGQFALPGGRVDAGETARAAALRELHEELRLESGESDLLGVLDDFPTRSGFRIRPFVVWVEDSSMLAPDPREVATCHRIPLADLMRPGVPAEQNVTSGAGPLLSMHLHSLGEEIYAPTAAMLYQFREVALAGRPTRVSHYEQPQFAWR